MFNSPDENIREEIYLKENKIILCNKHSKNFIGKSYVIKIEPIRFPIECGFHSCSDIGIFEVQIKNNSLQIQLQESMVITK